MTDTAAGQLPRWSPRPDLNVADLANALEYIRRMAWGHAVGGAFEPKHMHAIAALAAQALCGEPTEAPVDTASSEWKAMIEEDYQALLDCCDDEDETPVELPWCPDCVHGPSAHRRTTGCIRCTCNYGRGNEERDDG